MKHPSVRAHHRQTMLCICWDSIAPASTKLSNALSDPIYACGSSALHVFIYYRRRHCTGSHVSSFSVSHILPYKTHHRFAKTFSSMKFFAERDERKELGLRLLCIVSLFLRNTSPKKHEFKKEPFTSHLFYTSDVEEHRTKIGHH